MPPADTRRYFRSGLVLTLFAILIAGALVASNDSFGSDEERILAAIAQAGSMTQGGFTEQVRLYRELLDKVGALRAQEGLRSLGLPSNSVSHLLNHESGRFLFARSGDAGITMCKDYFLDSCFHGFVIESVAAHGPESLDRLAAVCGSEDSELSYQQCAHGLGHGILAWLDYKPLPQALEICEDLPFPDDRMKAGREACTGGVFMENFLGAHLGGPSPDRWYDPDDPLYPCTDPRVPDPLRLGCWSVQSQMLLSYPALGGDIGAAARYCAALEDPAYLRICVDGLARQIHIRSQSIAEDVVSLCKATGVYASFCEATVARSALMQDDPELAWKLCKDRSGEESDLCHDLLFAELYGKYATGASRKLACLHSGGLRERARCIEAVAREEWGGRWSDIFERYRSLWERAGEENSVPAVST